MHLYNRIPGSVLTFVQFLQPYPMFCAYVCVHVYSHILGSEAYVNMHLYNRILGSVLMFVCILATVSYVLCLCLYVFFTTISKGAFLLPYPVVCVYVCMHCDYRTVGVGVSPRRLPNATVIWFRATFRCRVGCPCASRNMLFCMVPCVRSDDFISLAILRML